MAALTSGLTAAPAGARRSSLWNSFPPVTLAKSRFSSTWVPSRSVPHSRDVREYRVIVGSADSTAARVWVAEPVAGTCSTHDSRLIPSPTAAATAALIPSITMRSTGATPVSGWITSTRTRSTGINPAGSTSYPVTSANRSANCRSCSRLAARTTWHRSLYAVATSAWVLPDHTSATARSTHPSTVTCRVRAAARSAGAAARLLPSQRTRRTAMSTRSVSPEWSDQARSWACSRMPAALSFATAAAAGAAAESSGSASVRARATSASRAR